MPVGFYELLQVAPDSPPERIRAAWQDQVAQVVRKIRSTEARKLDRAPVEARKVALNEAYAVLSDPARRRRYDRFREISRVALPTDPEELWRVAGPSLVDPGAAAAVELIRALSELKVGGPLVDAPAAPGRDAVATLPPGPEAGAVVVSIEDSSVTLAPPMPPPSLQPGPALKPKAKPTADGSASHPRPPKTGPVIDRTASTEALARLFDQYGPTGAFLRATREIRKVSLADMSALTRISQRFIDAMERDAYKELPGGTFVRGYLKMVIRGMEALDGSEVDEFIEGYMSRFHRARG